MKKSNPNPSQFKRSRYEKGLLSACKTIGNFPKVPKLKIYKTFEEKLQDEGCPVAAEYFKRLVAMEDGFVKTDVRFKKRVRDSYCLLLAIVENVKAAEDAYRSVGDQALTLRLLLQTIYMIQAQDDAFNWLVKEFYKIIFKISKGWEHGGGDCSEMLSRACFEYGVVVADTDDDLEESISYMEKCLETCKGTMWRTNDSDSDFLQDDNCWKLWETLLRVAASNAKKSPNISATYAERAAQAISEAGTKESPILYCTAKIRESEYLIGNQNHKEAFEVLKSIEELTYSHKAPRNQCEFGLLLGICHFQISPDGEHLAIEKLKQSLTLSDENNFADLKAKTLLNLGKIHSKWLSTYGQARECFLEAKELFQRLRDFENEKLAKYLTAQLRAYQIFPNYLELIKRASMNSFCHFYDLLQWQQKLLPFWTEDGELRQHEDKIQCILEDRLADEISASHEK